MATGLVLDVVDARGHVFDCVSIGDGIQGHTSKRIHEWAVRFRWATFLRRAGMVFGWLILRQGSPETQKSICEGDSGRQELRPGAMK